MSGKLLVDCWPLIAALLGCAVVAVLLRRDHARPPGLRHLRRLAADQRGAVQSLSFVLTLPVFVMLMLFIIQLSQLTIARIVVEYSAYAAARSAIVWIPADLGDGVESANRVGIQPQFLGTIRDETGQEYTRYLLGPPSNKLRRIHLAAAQALLSVCPSRDAGASLSHPGMAALPALERSYQTWDPSSTSNSRIPVRLRNKLAYALSATSVAVEVRHKEIEPPLSWHDLQPYTEEFAVNEIGWQDQILVTVRHDFALLPGPARLLARRTSPPGQNVDEVAERIEQRSGVAVYSLSATVRLGNEGEKPVLAYVHDRP